MQQKHSRREVYNKASLPQEGRKTTNKQPKLTPRATRKIKTTPPPEFDPSQPRATDHPLICICVSKPSRDQQS